MFQKLMAKDKSVSVTYYFFCGGLKIFEDLLYLGDQISFLGERG